MGHRSLVVSVYRTNRARMDLEGKWTDFAPWDVWSQQENDTMSTDIRNVPILMTLEMSLLSQYTFPFTRCKELSVRPCLELSPLSAKVLSTMRVFRLGKKGSGSVASNDLESAISVESG